MVLVVKNPPANAGDARDAGSIPGSVSSPGGGNPLQYSCLENSMDRGTCWATVHSVSKSQTQLKRLSKHVHVPKARWWHSECTCLPLHLYLWEQAPYLILLNACLFLGGKKHCLSGAQVFEGDFKPCSGSCSENNTGPASRTPASLLALPPARLIMFPPGHYVPPSIKQGCWAKRFPKSHLDLKVCDLRLLRVTFFFFFNLSIVLNLGYSLKSSRKLSKRKKKYQYSGSPTRDSDSVILGRGTG